MGLGTEGHYSTEGTFLFYKKVNFKENQRGVFIAHSFEFWGGRIRTYGWRYQKPLPYHLATPQFH